MLTTPSPRSHEAELEGIADVLDEKKKWEVKSWVVRNRWPASAARTRVVRDGRDHRRQPRRRRIQVELIDRHYDRCGGLLGWYGGRRTADGGADGAAAGASDRRRGLRLRRRHRRPDPRLRLARGRHRPPPVPPPAAAAAPNSRQSRSLPAPWKEPRNGLTTAARSWSGSATAWSVTGSCRPPSSADSPRPTTYVVIGEGSARQYDQSSPHLLLRARCPGAVTLRPEGQYDDPRVTLRVGTIRRRGVLGKRQRIVTLAERRGPPYDKLVLAAGSYPFVPPVPGREARGGASCTAPSRTWWRSARPRQRARRGAVIGGGLLGPGSRQGAGRTWGWKRMWSNSRRA